MTPQERLLADLPMYERSATSEKQDVCMVALFMLCILLAAYSNVNQMKNNLYPIQCSAILMAYKKSDCSHRYTRAYY